VLALETMKKTVAEKFAPKKIYDFHNCWVAEYLRMRVMCVVGLKADGSWSCMLNIQDKNRAGCGQWEPVEAQQERLDEYKYRKAVKAWKEAVFYLDPISPKPDGYAELKEKLAKGEEELSRRYKDQRFLADKAINLGDWEQAQIELKILCELVPEKDDPRHSEANAKLVDVENRMKKSKGGR
jgi:hypothetical protein